MKRGLDANSFAPKQATDMTLQFLYKIFDDLKRNGIGNGSYTGLQLPLNGSKIFMCHENGKNRSEFIVSYGEKIFSITSVDNFNFCDDKALRSPLCPEQMQDCTGITTDHNQFIDALAYILAAHYPSQATKIVAVMSKYKKPEVAPAVSGQTPDP